jgi:hypothetical protein
MRRTTKTALAVDFLQHTLGDGHELPAAELERLARSAGLLEGQQRIGTVKAFVSARRHLGISSRQKGRRWHWRLPDATERPKMAATAQTASISDAATRGCSPASSSELPRSTALTAFQTSLRPALPYRGATTSPVGTIREWFEGLDALNVLRPAARISDARWLYFVRDAYAFLDRWGDRALATGWTAVTLFGIDPDRGMTIPARLGLVWRIEGARVLEVDGGGAMIQHGPATKFRARPLVHPSTCVPWRIPVRPTGPPRR